VPIYICPPHSITVDCTQSATFTVDYMVQIIGKTELILQLLGVKLTNCFLLWQWMSSLFALKASKSNLCTFVITLAQLTCFVAVWDIFVPTVFDTGINLSQQYKLHYIMNLIMHSNVSSELRGNKYCK